MAHSSVTPASSKPDAKVTSVLMLLGTAVLSFFPLYVAHFHAAVTGGGLLLIASVFASDAVLRCFSPQTKATNWRLLFGIGALTFVFLTASEYAPIANRLLRQDYAVESFVRTGGTNSLQDYAMIEQKSKLPATTPNDSIFLVVASLLLDAGTIFVLEQ